VTLDEALAHVPLVAILRGVRPQEVVATAQSLYDAGVRAVEVPLNSPEPFASIAVLAGSFGDRMAVGAGTVLAAAEVDRVREAGGRLIVSPNVDVAVIERALRLGLDVAPGFASASEAFTAVAAGASVLKLFPASTFGPGHVTALKAVLPPGIRVIAVGGVGSTAFAAWRAAGADGFGIGSELYRPGALPAEVLVKAQACVAALKG
jgi:2-dehydro-3-deoxyphosphogalactonate aldolase